MSTVYQFWFSLLSIVFGCSNARLNMVQSLWLFQVECTASVLNCLSCSQVSHIETSHTRGAAFWGICNLKLQQLYLCTAASISLAVENLLNSIGHHDRFLLTETSNDISSRLLFGPFLFRTLIGRCLCIAKFHSIFKKDVVFAFLTSFFVFGFLLAIVQYYP